MALFRRFDVNGNGTLGFDELRELLLIVGVPAADIPGLFGIIDTNADGNVDFDEFVRWMWMQPVDAKEKMVGSTAVARQLLQEIADRLDADHVPYDTLFSNADVSRDGLLSRDELSRILLAYLPDVTSSVLTETFNLCDMDNSGWINVQEFVAALRREASSFKAAVPSTVDVEVSIPPGWRYGMQLPVTYDGHMYYVDVPAGCTVRQISDLTDLDEPEEASNSQPYVQQEKELNPGPATGATVAAGPEGPEARAWASSGAGGARCQGQTYSQALTSPSLQVVDARPLHPLQCAEAISVGGLDMQRSEAVELQSCVISSSCCPFFALIGSKTLPWLMAS
ncbi:CPK29 [Symbiodinium necroappetens]|uniref:CPK29 protein n=1 Tax=Symbiodinium necroappetens TaxID=1628268 RepID=A0A813BS95_9DINO|nr:CPK29 [Symbiodinium necroappetens]